LKQYIQANNGQYPTDISQLQTYFNPPVDEAVLQRWEVVPTSTVPTFGGPDKFVLTQAAAVDADYDDRWTVGLTGWGTAGIEDWESPGPRAILAPAKQAYSAANNGLAPTDASQLSPYVTTPEQQAALQKLITYESK
jgi:hypothetical protein